MASADVLKIFRLLAAEFAGVDDDTVNQWIDLTAPLVSRKKFGVIWSQALALLTAHRMKLGGAGAEAGSDPLADMGSISAGNLMRVSNYSEGEVSIGFNSDVTKYVGKDAELSLTPYGIQYLNLSRTRIMTIVSAGEYSGRV